MCAPTSIRAHVETGNHGRDPLGCTWKEWVREEWLGGDGGLDERLSARVPRLSSKRFICTVNKLGAGIKDITGTVLVLKCGPSMASFSVFNRDCSENLTQRLHHFSPWDSHLPFCIMQSNYAHAYTPMFTSIFYPHHLSWLGKQRTFWLPGLPLRIINNSKTLLSLTQR